MLNPNADNNSNISTISIMNLLDSKSICLQNLFLKTRCRTEPNEHPIKPSKDKFKISDLIQIRAIAKEKTSSGKLDPIKKVKSISQFEIRNHSLSEKRSGQRRQKLVFLKFFHAKKAINTDLRNYTLEYKKKKDIPYQRVENISSFSILTKKKLHERSTNDCLDNFTIAEKDILLSHLKQTKPEFQKNNLPLAKLVHAVQVVADPNTRSNSRFLRKNKWIL